jgi:putative DNA primase/helicase
LLVRVKGNLSAPPKALRFAVVSKGDEDDPCLVEWQGEVDGESADDLLRPANDDEEPSEEPSKVAEAQEWLTEALSQGPVPSKSLQSDAREACIAWRTVERAKRKLGVKAYKNGHWVWELPRRADTAA